MIATDVLTREEIKHFSKSNDVKAAWVILANWGMIAGIFAMVAVWPNVFTVLLAIALLGARQLGLAVIMHECGHGSMFTRWSWNKFAAQWLAASFILSDAKQYRIKHGKHHRLGGTEEDPDLANYRDYAIARARFLRKIRRDLTGRTAIKIFLFSVKTQGWRGVLKWSVANGAMLAVLWAAGHPLLYLLWPAAWATSHMVVIRIRQAAEHAAVPDLYDPDPRKHTRTTIPRPWERLFLAPNQVNYHLEHHILPSVPCYNLKAFHKHLKAKGVLDGADICQSYWQVIGKLILPAGAEAESSAAA
jgi:fatty acid desaturase